jgi:chorismate mutase / prephenate dehydratase
MDLAELRQQIDALDEQIVELLNRRAQVVVQVGKIKNAGGAPIYSPDREKAVLERIRTANQGPLPDKTLVAIYRELMSGCFTLQKPLRIAYLGPEGSYSHLAATEHFGASVEYQAVSDIRAVFEEVARQQVNFGLVPIENSTGGGVIDTLDAFVETDVHICAEINRAIHHSLLANAPLEKVNRVYSKPEVFLQCQRWLAETGFAAKTIPVASTSKAAELARSEEGAAAIGSKLAAEIYGLKLITQNIEDKVNNVTRFFVLGPESARPTGDDKTALMFTTAHKAGALVDVLNVFRDAGISLTMITSRPSKKRNWEYYFFVDAEGHAENPTVRQAIEDARQHCIELEILGSFPKASEVT